MTDNVELIGVINSVKNYCIGMATGGEFDYEKYEAERQKLLAYPELKHVLPDWFIKCRYGQQYWQYISNKFKHYQERRIYLRSEFDEMIEAVQQGLTKPVSITLNKALESIDLEELTRLWSKAIERSESDFQGSITASKSLLESVMKYILDQEKIGYTKRDDFTALYKKVKKSLNLDPSNHDINTYKQILTGITSVVQGVGTLRNEYGDAHGVGEGSFSPQKRHADLVLNLTGSLCSFFLDAYKSKVKP